MQNTVLDASCFSSNFLYYILLCVVRGYVTGSTDTSLWTVYKKGVRNYCGNALSDGTVSFVVIFKLSSS